MAQQMIQATVQKIWSLSPDVRGLQIKPETDLKFVPGQYMLVRSPGGVSRHYSIAHAHQLTGSLEFFIKMWPNGNFSDQVLSYLREGDKLEISKPCGGFFFPDGNDPIIMLATSTGIAPFHAMLEKHLPTSGHRQIDLYWGVRSRKDCYIAETLKSWRALYPNFQSQCVVSSLGMGHIQDFAVNEHLNPGDTIVLACGSGAMINDAYRVFVQESKTPVKAFYSDIFNAAEDPPDALPKLDSTLPTVSLNIDGQELTVSSGGTLLNALRSSDQPILSVCGGKASCGTCLVEIDKNWVERIPKASKKEERLLATLPNVTGASRLSCQIDLTTNLNGLTLCIHNTV